MSKITWNERKMKKLAKITVNEMQSDGYALSGNCDAACEIARNLLITHTELRTWLLSVRRANPEYVHEVLADYILAAAR